MASCRFHCTACDRHFSSLEGFDRHRRGTAEDRHCVDPAAHPAVFRETIGQCRLFGDGEVHRDEVVWSRPIDPRAQARLAALAARG